MGQLMGHITYKRIIIFINHTNESLIERRVSFPSHPFIGTRSKRSMKILVAGVNPKNDRMERTTSKRLTDMVNTIVGPIQQ